MSNPETWHGTTILGVRKDGKVVVAGDGQVSLGQTVIKPNARKVRRLGADPFRTAIYELTDAVA